MIVLRELKNYDLAPGDLRSHAFDWEGFEFVEVLTPDDADFARIYEALAVVFEPKGEMETPDILQHRLGWQDEQPRHDHRFFYRMLALQKDGLLAAVRDHTVIVTTGPAPRACVHLSHVYVDPAWRRSGLAGWMRAFPVADARQACLQSGLPVTTPVTLVAEMEPLTSPEQIPRLKAYARAGFRRVDPDKVSYHQPDFRHPEEIDAAGGPLPLPFWLMIRQVGAENDDALSGLELKRLVTSLYEMYATGFREQDMAPLWAQLESYPSAHASIALEKFDPQTV